MSSVLSLYGTVQNNRTEVTLHDTIVLGLCGSHKPSSRQSAKSTITPFPHLPSSVTLYFLVCVPVKPAGFTASGLTQHLSADYEKNT